MASSNETLVQYEYHSAETQDVLLNDDDVNDLEIDHSGTPAVMRGGIARRLLAGSVLACMGGTLAAGLGARGVAIESLRGQAQVHMAPDPPKRVQAIDIQLRLKVPAGSETVVDKVEKMLSKGCLISRSLKPAIEIRESIIREYS
jgi:organic hydroperoxide reductase OsmC/OhrA